MCAKSTNSILRSKNFNEFKLSCVITEMESHAPFTLSLLRSCLTGRKATDKNEIHSNFSFLVARVLKKHMAFFKMFGKGTVKRLRHEYSCEMGQKSEVVSTLIISVSLGICCLFIIIIDSTWRDSSE